MIFILPHLKILDFNKIKQSERDESKRIYGENIEKITAQQKAKEADELKHIIAINTPVSSNEKIPSGQAISLSTQNKYTIQSDSDVDMTSIQNNKEYIQNEKKRLLELIQQCNDAKELSRLEQQLQKLIEQTR